MPERAPFATTDLASEKSVRDNELPSMTSDRARGVIEEYGNAAKVDSALFDASLYGPIALTSTAMAHGI